MTDRKIEMISHSEAQGILAKAVRHLDRKMALEEECPECGCFPINQTEISLLFKYLGQIEGVAGVSDGESAPATATSGSVAFPVKRAQ